MRLSDLPSLYHAEIRTDSSFPSRIGTKCSDGRASCSSRSMIGSAKHRGNCAICSHFCQQTLAISSMGKNKSAAFCHSIAAVKGNPFLSSLCAARQYLSARVVSPANESSRRNFRAGCLSLPLTNWNTCLIHSLLCLSEQSYDPYSTAVLLLTPTAADLFPHSLLPHISPTSAATLLPAWYSGLPE